MQLHLQPEYFSLWFLFIIFPSTHAQAQDPCCETGQTLESDSYCVSQPSQVRTKTLIHDNCQGRLQQMDVGQFVRTKFGGLKELILKYLKSNISILGLLHGQRGVVVPDGHFCTNGSVVVVCDTCLEGDCIQVCRRRIRYSDIADASALIV